jgi:hypothetical protein
MFDVVASLLSEEVMLALRMTADADDCDKALIDMERPAAQ